MSSFARMALFGAVLLVGTVAASAATVTLVANSGYVFRTEELAVAIDAFASYRTSREMQSSMLAGDPPYDVDVILVTHSHFDHFDASLVAGNMRTDRSPILIGPRDVIGAVRSRATELPEDRFIEAAPTTEEPLSLEVGGLELTCYLFPHPPSGLPVNLGYLFELDSVTFFHPGDLDVQDRGALFAHYALDEAAVDVAFLPSFMFTDTGLQDALHSLGAGCFVPTHASPLELRFPCELGGETFGNLVCFTTFMEEIEFMPEAECSTVD